MRLTDLQPADLSRAELEDGLRDIRIELRAVAAWLEQQSSARTCQLAAVHLRYMVGDTEAKMLQDITAEMANDA